MRHKGNARTLNFKRGNFSELCSLQDIKWDQILQTMNTEEKFRNILNNDIGQCIPMGNKYKNIKYLRVNLSD